MAIIRVGRNVVRQKNGGAEIAAPLKPFGLSRNLERRSGLRASSFEASGLLENRKSNLPIPEAAGNGVSSSINAATPPQPIQFAQSTASANPSRRPIPSRSSDQRHID